MGWDVMGRDYESCKIVAAAVRVCGGLSVHLACSAQAAAAAKSCAGAGEASSEGVQNHSQQGD